MANRDLYKEKLVDLLIQALPIVEDAATFDNYDESGKAAIRNLARQIRQVAEDSELDA